MMSLHVFSYELTYKSICVNRNTDTYEAVRSEGVQGNLVTKLSQLRCDIKETVWHIKDNLSGTWLKARFSQHLQGYTLKLNEIVY